MRADFAYEVEHTPAAEERYARFIARVCREEGLLPFNRRGVAAMVEFGQKHVSDQRKLTLQFGRLVAVLKEADYWARRQPARIVSEAHVVPAFLPLEELPEGEQLLALYRSVMHGKWMLLLMDDARDAAQVKDLIPPPGSILLVTSRFHFTLPGLKAIDLNKLPPDDVRALVVAIAPRLGETTGDLAGELCRMCDYLPLALLTLSMSL